MKKRFKDYEEKTLKRFKSKGGLEGKVDMVFDLYSMREYLDDLAEKIEKLEKMVAPKEIVVGVSNEEFNELKALADEVANRKKP